MPCGMTFRLAAPQARKVTLQAEGRDATPGITPEQLKKQSEESGMTKGADGIWSIQIGPIQRGILSERRIWTAVLIQPGWILSVRMPDKPLGGW